MSSIASQLSFSKARDVVGGATGSIPYQTANSSTVFIPIGTNGFVLTSNGTTATWSAASGVTAGSANTILVTATTTASSYYLTFVDSNNAAAAFEALYTDAGILYNPNSDLLTLTGNLTVNGGSLQTSQTTFNLVNTTATIVNLAGAATSLTVGATTGVTEIRNATTVSSTTLSSSTLTGALKVLGGIGANNLFVSNAKIVSPNTDGNTAATIPLDIQGAWIRLGDATTAFTQSSGIGIKLHDSGNTHWSLAMTGTNFVIAITSTNGDQLLPASRTDAISIDSSGNITAASNITATGDVAVNGGDITTNQTSFNLLNTNATTVNFGGVSTNTTIGVNGTGTVTIRNNTNASTTATGGLVVYGGVGIGGNLYVGGTINGTVSTSGNANAILTTATSTASSYYLTFVVDNNTAAAAYEAVYTDAGLSYNPNTDLLTLSGDIAVNGGDITSTAASFNLLNSNVTTASILGAGTNITIGATTGATTVRNDTTITSTTAASSTATGSLQVRGGLGVGGNIYLGGTLHGAVNSATNLAGGQPNAIVYQSNTATTAYLAPGTAGFLLQTNGSGSAPTWVAATGVSAGSANTATNADNIRTVTRSTAATHYLTFVDSDNVSATYESLYTDGGISYNPSTDSLVLTGDLTVNGGDIDTTAVTVTVFNTSATTVSAFGAATAITLGATTGVTTIRNATTVTSTTAASSTATGAFQVRGGAGIGGNLYVGGNTVVVGNLTVQGSTTIVDSTVTNVSDPIFIIGSGPNGADPTADDNKDRGIQFKYHNGTSAKNGFFGYDDSSGFFTFVPDATITNEVVSGTKGALDANLAGGAAMSVIYQSAANTTAFLAAGTAGQILQTNGTGSAPTWVNVSTLSAGTSSQVTTVQQPASATYFPVFVDSNNASATAEALYTTSSFRINPSTGNTEIVVNTAGTSGLQVYGGSQYVSIRGNMTAGANNNITQAGDSGIIFTNGTQDTGNFIIAPWVTAGTSGLRITNAGFVGIGIATPTATLHVAGGTRITGVSTVSNTTAATSTITGALQVAGGAGVGGDIYAGGDVYSRGTKVVPLNIQEFTATGGQTTFTISGGYTVGTVQITANGVALGSGAFVASNGTTVVVNTARSAGDIIRVVSGGTSSAANNIQSYSIAMSVALGA
jgi:hypothetical protein